MRHAAAPAPERSRRKPTTPTQSSALQPRATRAGALRHDRRPRVGRAHQRRQHRRLPRVEAAGRLPNRRCASGVDALELAAEGHEVEIGLEDLALGPGRARARVAVCAWPTSARALRPPCRARQAVVEQAGELHRQRRRRRASGVDQVAPGAPGRRDRQSTPLCSQKRRSSLGRSRVSSGRRHRRRAAPSRAGARRLSTRSVWIGTPWRSSRRASSERPMRRLHRGEASGTRAPRSTPRRRAPSASSSVGTRSAIHGCDLDRSRSASRRSISGAYIASTRVAGSSNVPGLLRRTRVLDDDACRCGT